MPDLWDNHTCDGLLRNPTDDAQEMYVTKGDTWVFTQVGSHLSVAMLTLEQAKARWQARLKRGWKITHLDPAWQSLMGPSKGAIDG